MFPLLPGFQFYPTLATIPCWVPSPPREEPLSAHTSRFRPAPPPSPSSARARPLFPPFSRSALLAPFLPSAFRLHIAPFSTIPGPPTRGPLWVAPTSARLSPLPSPFPPSPPPPAAPPLPAPRLAILLLEPRAPPGPSSLASRSLAPSSPFPARPSLPAASRAPCPRPDLQWRPPSAAPRGQRATTEPPAAVAAAASTACALPALRREHFRGRARERARMWGRGGERRAPRVASPSAGELGKGRGEQGWDGVGGVRAGEACYRSAPGGARRFSCAEAGGGYSGDPRRGKGRWSPRARLVRTLSPARPNASALQTGSSP